ncbi:MAG: D-tyrosyl-tRNA(Tyr) deacylase [Spirochaetaceae bacterium]|jgi:D-tyrosyl-tRNA(Tyr) deacylase|nr:D-tyrosyl-tRNA(Tyr) deacylase [Spirochaetaceae bacterium]
MRAVVQRVKEASVSVEGVLQGNIGLGLLIYLGVAQGDTEVDARYLAEKIVGLRVFEDTQGKMNHSVREAGGSLLLVSQFTLLGDARKGRRPSYSEAAEPGRARDLYEYLMGRLRESGLTCASGVFQTHMAVRSTNDGPVTLLLDSRKCF